MAPLPLAGDQERPASFSRETTCSQAQRQLARCFTAAGLDLPQLDARILLCAALAIDHAALVRDPDRVIGASAGRLTSYADRRLAHEPVSRILGQREFWGLPFAITEAVLDPRPDTEVLVEGLLDVLGARVGDPLRILDLGTGSGALLCALLHSCPEAYGLGLDHSAEACRVARANMRQLGLEHRGAIVQGFWSDALAGPFDVVVSNPPYIARHELAALAPEVRCYDPLLALDGGEDGFEAYRRLMPDLPRLLGPGGVAGFEGGSTQAMAIAAMMSAAGLIKIQVRNDLSGIGRATIGLAPPDRGVPASLPRESAWRDENPWRSPGKPL